jgi:hypothetical protein
VVFATCCSQDAAGGGMLVAIKTAFTTLSRKCSWQR